MHQKVLYIGGFELPDKNAAAQRVIGIAKAIRRLGNDVVFLYRSRETANGYHIEEKNFFGFRCYEVFNQKEFNYRLGCQIVMNVIQKESIDVVIAYNYPSVALAKILMYCHKCNIKVIADVTEWESAAGSFIYRIVKNCDTKLRMEFIHPKMDGIIAISKYLFDYYDSKTQTVQIPPLVDLTDKKWKRGTKDESNTNITRLIYAGSPSPEKERLDIIVASTLKVAKKFPVELHIVGLTRNQFCEAYNWKGELGDAVQFLGRLEHTQAIEEVKAANWSIIIRENSRKIKAGFPTKLVESITCGTPIVANLFSNIDEYLNENNSIVCKDGDLTKSIEKACITRRLFDDSIFDYNRYADILSTIL